MIDNFSIIFFGMLIIYTAYRAVKLDKMVPWFFSEEKTANIISLDDKE
jgi:hypothetical protein